MAPHLHRLDARGISATLDLGLGQVHSLIVHRDARDINPWARVPWADGADDADRFAPDMPPHLRRMSGDFFCAPFVLDDVEHAPPHGWTANGAWTLIEDIAISGGRQATFEIEQKIGGARVQKVWTLLDDHPFLYQCHRFIGGQGAMPVAHHALIDLREGGLLGFSPKRWAQTPDAPLEDAASGGRSVLDYPAQTTDLTAFPSSIGPIDLTRYPIADAHEDFAMLVDEPMGDYGWATALRPTCGDVALLIKPVAVLPQTMLWMSNGGRPYAPWNGEHIGVLGIEEACSYGGHGRLASGGDNPLNRARIPTALDLGSASVVEVKTAMGALPSGATTAIDALVEQTQITLSDGTVVPFAGNLLA